jgi:flavin reductase (DIM6/NTAB) family NADH-FMN oxidoreductase RutF
MVSMSSQSKTLQVIRDRGTFAINILGVGGEDVASRLATKSPDKFSEIRWVPSEDTGSPRIVDGVIAFADCQVVEQFEYSDHLIVIGRVTTAQYGSATEPLVYFEREYHHLKKPAEAGFPRWWTEGLQVRATGN